MQTKTSLLIHGIATILYLIIMGWLMTRQYDGSGLYQSVGVRWATIAIFSIFVEMLLVLELLIEYLMNLIKKQKWFQSMMIPGVIAIVLLVVIMVIVNKLNIY
ncbi:hypothetical protein ACYATP_02495 [Lactobacillaceae bacterium Melli_B4]